MNRVQENTPSHTQHLNNMYIILAWINVISLTTKITFIVTEIGTTQLQEWTCKTLGSYQVYDENTSDLLSDV